MYHLGKTSLNPIKMKRFGVVPVRKACLLMVLAISLISPLCFASQEKELFEKGVKLLKTNQFLEAVDTFSALLELDPDNPDAYKNRGVAYMKLNQYDLAIHDFERTREIIPNLKGLYSNLGVAWYYKSDYAKAIENYDKEISISPDSHYAYFNRAICRAELKDYTRSLADIQKTLELEPAFYLAYCLKGDLYLNMGNRHEARTAYESAVSVDPKQEYARTKLEELGPAPAPVDTTAGKKNGTVAKAMPKPKVPPNPLPDKAVPARPSAPKAAETAPAVKPKPSPSIVSAPKEGRPKKKKPKAAPEAFAGASAPFTDGYALQTGAFRVRSNAEVLMKKLKDKGYFPRMLTLTRSTDITWYLVRMGHYDNKDDAKSAETLFKEAAGMDAIVRPAGRF